MTISKRKDFEPQKEVASDRQGDDALLQAVRAILVGQERDKLEDLEEKLLSWQNKVLVSGKLTQTRFENVLIEIKELQRKSSKEGLIERLTPLMTNLLKQSMLDSPQDIAESLGPLMGSAIRQRVSTQKEDIVDALYPVIGEAISKSVSEAVSELARSIDQRTRKRSPAEKISAQLQGVSASELLFRDNLPYQIQYVFIIHRKSGLLLAQTSPSGELREDLDMISGMLTAIRDFAQDSLGDDGELSEIKHGEQWILLQTSQDVYVAAVLSGTIPQGYNALSRLVLSEINAKHEREFREFDGDMDVLTPLTDELRPLLYPYDILKSEEMSPKQKKTIFALLGAFLLALSFIIFSCIFAFRLFPYAFPTATLTPTSTPQPTFTFTLEPTSTLTLTPSPTVTVTFTPTATPTPQLEQAIAGGNSYIRKDPDRTSEVIGVLYEGDSILILKETGDWLYIRYDIEGESQIEGWVSQTWIIR